MDLDVHEGIICSRRNVGGEKTIPINPNKSGILLLLQLK